VSESVCVVRDGAERYGDATNLCVRKSAFGDLQPVVKCDATSIESRHNDVCVVDRIPIVPASIPARRARTAVRFRTQTASATRATQSPDY
jgi:hypothetical protein